MFFTNSAIAGNIPDTSSIYGFAGLNTVPNARMHKSGTINLTASALDPYTHISLGFQPCESLYIGLRQSAETSGVMKDAEKMYPGVDLKINLAKESEYRPEISIGLQSATGHKRMAGEYLALSKKLLDFDITAGIGWGRFGSAGQIDNPLSKILPHFDKERPLDGDAPNKPDNWFTGKKAGLFGGIEYFPPLKIKGLSLKLDIGADRYLAEKTTSDFNAPAPWSLSVNYTPKDWLDISAGTAGGDKIFGTLSLRSPLKKWPGRYIEKKETIALSPYRTPLTLPGEIDNSAKKEEIELDAITKDNNTIKADLNFSQDLPLPMQIGRAARHISNNAGESPEEIRIVPIYDGLRGPSISIARADFERALSKTRNGSPQEIWQNAKFDQENSSELDTRKGSNEKLFHDFHFRLKLSNDISLSEEDSGILYRSAILAKFERRIGSGLISGEEWRLNLKDNLLSIREYRPYESEPTRSDIDVFTQRTISAERAYMGWMTTLDNNLYAGITGGYLEEMYAGAGGEILYRPFGKTWAIGGELWRAYRRTPYAALNLGLNGDVINTGHINAWYEIPDSELTIEAKLGRYLAGDWGGSLSLNREFDNGAKMSGFVTITDQDDYDIFGEKTNLYSGIKFTLPIGNTKFIPENTEIQTEIAPIGRDNGQTIDKPLPLYQLTDKFSQRHIANHWNSILE